MLVYFAVIALLGVINVVAAPRIFGAINPYWAVHFFTIKPSLAFLALGSVVLAVTGAEALYADMGHFGQRPISAAWLYLVFPCLLLNYFGQGALLLGNPQAVAESLLPDGARMVAPAARLPRDRGDDHRQPGGDLRRLLGDASRRCNWASCRGSGSSTPASKAAGQIFVPFVNWTLLVLVVIARPRLQGIGQARLGLWHRCHRHDVHHHLHARRAAVQRLEVEPAARRLGDRPVPARRRRSISPRT